MGKLRERLKTAPGLRSGVFRLRRMRNRARLLLRPPRGNLRRLQSLKDTHRGQRAWIIGNGPSLRKLDLSLLAGEITLGSNSIWLLFEEIDWRPTYYVVEDVLVAADNDEAIHGLRGMTKLFPVDLMDTLRPDPDTIYFNLLRGEYPGFPRFSTACDRIVYFGQTVSYDMLQLAFWMGCDPIYLIGMDMSYSIPDHAKGEVITSREDDVNHFHPAYFGKGKRWHQPYVERMIECMSHGCRVIQDHERRAFNATPGGRLETFPRVSYEEVLGAPPHE